MSAFAAALLNSESGNDDPTLIVVTPPPVARSADYQRGYEAALGDAGAVLDDEVSMPAVVIAYLLDLARARERAR